MFIGNKGIKKDCINKKKKKQNLNCNQNPERNIKAT